MRSTLYEADHEEFRATVRARAETTVASFHAEWEPEGTVPREVWTSGGAQGLLYREEYPVSRAWRNALVPSVYGGTNEIMREIIGRSMGL